MDITDKPMETIKQWQDWYHGNQENKAPFNCSSFDDVFMDNAVYKQKAIEYFSDTIAEFNNEMSGLELFECFKKAVSNYYNAQQKELNRTKELFDLVNKTTCVKTCEK